MVTVTVYRRRGGRVTVAAAVTAVLRATVTAAGLVLTEASH